VEAFLEDLWRNRLGHRPLTGGCTPLFSTAPLQFDFDAFVEDSLTVMRGPRIDVELEFDKPTAAWAKHRVWHPSQELKRLQGGKLRMALSVAESRELVGWVLSFGSGVRVVKPDRLRAAVEAEARCILRNGQ
jgi:predicted DNA-binding transcriptional regulator YafY